MKMNLLRISIVAVLAAGAAFAQGSTLLKANVPFDFNAGKLAMPAGQYTVDRGPASGTLMIRSADGKNAAIVMTEAVSTAIAREGGSLVFHRYGSTYFLSTVWTPGNDGRKLFPTSRERELAASSAVGNTTIAATR